ncbi:17524_t:CDS:1 [Cetraspora pellucida]|uniref:17524_t:CDS:1 n=1 Tax=Cetraspora pellucida TaxID=1433469 RepID=A0ACA9LQL8_9GLOM|nr:17524_t:CDS:1 [Cetraspora pellucida]
MTAGPTTEQPCSGYEPGPIFATYQSGQTIPITWTILTAHGGNCSVQLSINGKDSEFQELKSYSNCADAIGTFNDNVQLPAGIACDKCTFRWVWNSALNDELYLQCADIKIGGESNNSTNTVPLTTTLSTPLTTTLPILPISKTISSGSNTIMTPTFTKFPMRTSSIDKPIKPTCTSSIAKSIKQKCTSSIAKPIKLMCTSSIAKPKKQKCTSSIATPKKPTCTSSIATPKKPTCTSSIAKPKKQKCTSSIDIPKKPTCTSSIAKPKKQKCTSSIAILKKQKCTSSIATPKKPTCTSSIAIPIKNSKPCTRSSNNYKLYTTVHRSKKPCPKKYRKYKNYIRHYRSKKKCSEKHKRILLI